MAFTRHDIVYSLVDDVASYLSSKLPPDRISKDVARAEVAFVQISVDRSAQRALKAQLRQKRLAAAGATLNGNGTRAGLGGFPLRPKNRMT